MQYLPWIAIIIVFFVLLEIYGKIRNLIGYKTTLKDVEYWVDTHLRGAGHNCRLFLRHRESSRCVEFCKWAPYIRWFGEKCEPSEYYLILREGRYCSPPEFDSAQKLIEEQGVNYDLKTSENNERVLKARIGPDSHLGDALVSSVFKVCFALPDCEIRASIIGGIDLRRPDYIKGWTDRASRRAIMLAEQKKYEGKSKLHQWAPVKKVSWLSPLKDRINKDRKGIDIQNEHGATPLVAASYFGSFDVAGVLLEEGADIRARDNSGRTALHCAAWKGHEDVTQLLLDHGAPTDITDNEGKTPLDLAKEYDYPEIVRLLSERETKSGALDERDESEAPVT